MLKSDDELHWTLVRINVTCSHVTLNNHRHHGNGFNSRISCTDHLVTLSPWRRADCDCTLFLFFFCRPHPICGKKNTKAKSMEFQLLQLCINRETHVRICSLNPLIHSLDNRIDFLANTSLLRFSTAFKGKGLNIYTVRYFCVHYKKTWKWCD